MYLITIYFRKNHVLHIILHEIKCKFSLNLRSDDETDLQEHVLDVNREIPILLFI